MFSKKIGVLSYRCNICGHFCKTRVSELGRESRSCRTCGSTVRFRAIIHWLSKELFGQSFALPDFPARRDIRGLGMSDWDGYATPLAKKLEYINMFYHKEPRLDITTIDPGLEGKFDFIISSDVFEHVSPPISVAFANARRLLKPNGLFLFTVPYKLIGETEEHFPELYRYEIAQHQGKWILRNMTADGREQFFENLVFHGGPGTTLEMRLFSKLSLQREFVQAGFQHFQICHEPCFEFGIYWPQEWSLPMIARNPDHH